MKKSKRYLIAGLAIIAVTASSTLAYFTSTAVLPANSGGSPLELNITNGNVEITAKPGANAGVVNWSYDVARESSKPAYSALDAAGITTYENKHRSIDMIGLGALPTKNAADVGNGEFTDLLTYKRWKIGTPVIGTINYARPGDAFVMGQAKPYGELEADKGLVITNNSNLTVKVNVIAVTGAQDTFDALANAGWVFYAGDDETTLTQYTDATAFLGAINTLLSGSWYSKTLYIRLELPLATENGFQNKVVKNEPTNMVTGFDLSKLFTIKATQENNPGWNEDGTE